MVTFKDSRGNIIQLTDNKEIQWRISGYAITKNKANHFFMVQSGNGLWHFPGGGVEVNEDVFEGIHREYLEETGYRIKIEPQIYHLNEQPFYHTREQTFYHSLQLFFKAQLVNTRPDIRFITGHDATRQSSWIDLSSLQQNEIHETVQGLVQRLIDDRWL